MPRVRLSSSSRAMSASLRARSASTSISSEMSKRDCPYLAAPASAWSRFHWRSSVSVVTGASGPRLSSQALKSRLAPYLKFTEQRWSEPFAWCAPAQKPQAAKFESGSGWA